MNFNESTPRAELTIQGQVFQIPQCWKEGDTLNANEAAAMNQLTAENVRNNVAGKIKDGKEKSPDFIFSQADLDAYVREYEFGARSGRASSESKLPPDIREARRMAKEKILERLKAKEIKVSSVSAEKMEAMVAALAANPVILKEAQKRVKEMSKISLDALGLDDLMTAPTEGETSQAA